MGIDVQTLNFLGYCRQIGALNGNFLTLGRQGLHIRQQDVDAANTILGAIGLGNIHLFLQEDGFSEKILLSMGAATVKSIDASSFEGADIVHDMNKPLIKALKNKFDTVLDGGCLEHVFDIKQALTNAMDLIAINGHFISVTVANNFFGHGFYQFSPELFYRALSPENGFTETKVFIMEAVNGAKLTPAPDMQGRGGRLALAPSSTPTYMGVVSRKVEDIDVFTMTPQQSDYQTAWNAK